MLVFLINVILLPVPAGKGVNGNGSMIHIFSRGKGWMVFAITFVSSLIAELVTESITRDDNYYSKNPYPLSISLLVSAAIVFFINKNIEARNYDFNLSEIENKRKNQSVNNSLFFIPFRFWPLILFVLSSLNIILHRK